MEPAAPIGKSAHSMKLSHSRQEKVEETLLFPVIFTPF